MTISSKSTLTTQFTPDFKLENLVNGQILVYDNVVSAFVNTSSLSNTGVTIGAGNLADSSVGIPQLNTDNAPQVGAVLGVDVNGNLSYITLSGSSTASLSGLLDTAIVTPLAKQYLRYDGSIWKNADIVLNDITDVVTASPTLGQVFYFNGTSWVNSALDYSHLTGTPTIPVNNSFSFSGLSDSNNATVANGFLRWNGAASQIDYQATIAAADITGLATVATSGVYADLSGLPNLAIYATSASLATVATTGSYNDLSNKPFIPSQLAQLTDVSASSPLNNQFLRYNSTSSMWVASTVTIVQNLEDLLDVAYTSLSSGKFLKWDGAKWTDSLVDWTSLQSIPSTFTPSAHAHVPADITGLASYITGQNGTLNFVLLSDTNNTPVSNGFLRWNNAATQVDYTSTIPANTVTGLATVATSGLYSDLSGSPVLATVATSGLYSDLSGSPAVPVVLNDLSDVATNTILSGQVLRYNGAQWNNAVLSYNDLSNLPSLFSGSYVDLTNIPLTFAPSAHNHVMADVTDLVIPQVLSDLSDVSNSAPANGQVLTWSHSLLKWLPSTPSIANMPLDQLLDVVITTPVSSQALIYNGSNWVNALPSFADLTNVPSTFTPTSHAHVASDISNLNTWLLSQNQNLAFSVLSDATPTIVNNGYLRWNATGTNVIYQTTIPASDVTGLSTVATTGIYNDLTGKPSIPAVVDDLSDVVITTPVSSQVLRYNGTNWANSPVAYADVTGTPTNSSYTVLGLADTNNVAVNSGFLRWNAGGTQIDYQATISYADISGLSTVGHSGDYGDLLNSPAIPVNNDFSFIGLSDTSDVSPTANQLIRWDGAGTQIVYVSSIPYTQVSGLATIAHTGDYSDILNTPNLGIYALSSSLSTVATTGGYGDLLNLPNLSLYALVSNLSAVAFSGAYVDLTGKPNLNVYALSSSLSTVATTGDYGDILNLPTIPSNNSFSLVGLSDTDNSSIANGYLRWNGAGTSVSYETTIPYTVIAGLAAVANTGSYLSLADTPTIPTTFVSLADTNDTVVNNGFLRWNAGGTQIDYQVSIAVADVTGLSTVATTGLLNDLTDVITTAPATNEFLKYNGSNWINSAVSYGVLTNVPSTFAPTAHTHVKADITDFPFVPVNLDDLADVVASSPTNGQVLTWSTGPSKWVASSAFSTLENLSNTANTAIPNAYLRWNTNGTQVVYESNIDASHVTGLAVVATTGDIGTLDNVNTSGALSGYVLVYNSTTKMWNAQVNTGSAVGTLNLTDLNDVTISTPLVGKVLRYNGSVWVDAQVNYSDILNAPTNSSFSFVGLSDTNNVVVNHGFLRWNVSGSQIDYQATIPTTDITGLATVATTGVYNDLTGKPTVPVVLDDLANVSVASPGNNDVLSYSTSLGQWISLPPSATLLALDALTDVVVPSPVSKQALTWSGTAWVNAFIDYTSLLNAPALATVATSGSYADLINTPAQTLVALTDTNNTVVNNGFLRWNSGGSQVNYQATIATTDITGLATVATTGSYGDLSGAPANTILGLNDTDNAAVNYGFLRWNSTGTAVNYVLINAATDISGLATVATTGLLKDLSDVTAPAPNNGDILIFNTGSGKWIAQAAQNEVIWSIIATNTTAVNLGAYLVNTVSNTVTVTLPASPAANDLVRVVDYAGTFGTHNCVIVGNGKPIIGETKNLVLARNNTSISLTFIDNTQGWKVTSGLGEEEEWVQVTGNYSAKPGDALLVNTTSGAITITLPAMATSRINDRVRLVDMVGTFGSGKKCIVYSDTNIMGLNQTLDITASNASVELTYIGGTIGWKITQGVGETLSKANDILIDTNIYVSTTGNDLTGDGSMAFPYATLSGALSGLDQLFVASNAYVTINIAEGVYSSGLTTDVYHAFGSRIKITGDVPTVTATISSTFGTAITTAFGFTLASNPGIAANDFIAITGTTGTGEHSIIRGIYKVVSVSGNDVIINPNYQGPAGDLTSIVLTGGTVTKQKTILSYAGVSGIRLRSGNLRMISNVTVVGDNTPNTHGVLSGQVDTDTADSNNTGGTIDLGTNVNIYNFAGNGLYATYSGYINADTSSGVGTTITRCGGGLESSYNGVIRAQNIVISNITGSSRYKGMHTTYGGVIDAYNATVVGCGYEALYVKNGGIIKADNITVSTKNNLSGSGVSMVYASGTGACFIANIGGVTYSPTFNTTGNGNAYIGAP